MCLCIVKRFRSSCRRSSELETAGIRQWNGDFLSVVVFDDGVEKCNFLKNCKGISEWFQKNCKVMQNALEMICQFKNIAKCRSSFFLQAFRVETSLTVHCPLHISKLLGIPWMFWASAYSVPWISRKWKLDKQVMILECCTQNQFALLAFFWAECQR